MKNLIKVANELQKVMDFEEGGPPVDGTEEELTKWVEEAVDEIDYETDKFSESAIGYLIGMGLWRGPVVEEEEPEVEEAEVVEDVSDNLVDQVKAAGTMRDLKIICKDLDEFKSIRGQVTKYKTMKELREVMLGMLDPTEEVEPTPKAKAEKKPVEKKEPTAKKEPVIKKEPAVKKETAKKSPGIIATIVSLIEKSGKKGITKDEIHEQLVTLFPDRDEKSMRSTINVQVPNRVSKEKFPVEKLESGCYRKKA